MLLLFAKSLAIGLAVAVPMGPMGLLVVRRTLARGFVHGLEGGFGIATADGSYAAVAAFGLVAVTTFLVRQQALFQVGGGAALLWLAWGILRRPAPAADAATGRSGGGFAVMFGLTLANPTTILSFVAIFASLGPLTRGNDWVAASVMTAGVFLGSLAWWIALTGASPGAPAHLDRVMIWLNRGGGALIAAFGLVALVAGLSHRPHERPVTRASRRARPACCTWAMPSRRCRLAPRAPGGRALPAAHRGHRHRPLPARVRGGDPGRPGLARPRLGRPVRRQSRASRRLPRGARPARRRWICVYPCFCTRAAKSRPRSPRRRRAARRHGPRRGLIYPGTCRAPRRRPSARSGSPPATTSRAAPRRGEGRGAGRRR